MIKELGPRKRHRSAIHEDMESARAQIIILTDNILRQNKLVLLIY